MTALDDVNVQGIKDYIKKSVSDSFVGDCATPETLERMKHLIAADLVKLPMFDKGVRVYPVSVHFEAPTHMVDELITKLLEPSTDGSVQVGEGNGPEIVVGTKKTEIVDEQDIDDNTVSVTMQFTPVQPAEHIKLEFNVGAKP